MDPNPSPPRFECPSRPAAQDISAGAAEPEVKPNQSGLCLLGRPGARELGSRRAARPCSDHADGSAPAGLAVTGGRVLVQRLRERPGVGADVVRANDSAMESATVDAGQIRSVEIVEEPHGHGIDPRRRRGTVERQDPAGHGDEHHKHRCDECCGAHRRSARCPAGRRIRERATRRDESSRTHRTEYAFTAPS